MAPDGHEIYEPEIYWAAVLDLKCTWAIRWKTGRLPIPVLTLSSTHEPLVQQFAKTWGLTSYRTGAFWYAHATGERLEHLLIALQPFSRFRSDQFRAWITLCEHIRDHRGHRYKKLSPGVVEHREKLARRAQEIDPFRGGASRDHLTLQ